LREGREIDAAGLLGMFHQRTKLVMAHALVVSGPPGSITRGVVRGSAG
jgi:hypothetical protein